MKTKVIWKIIYKEISELIDRARECFFGTSGGTNFENLSSRLMVVGVSPVHTSHTFNSTN